MLLDTNVLVYAANVSAPEHEACRELVGRTRASPVPWHLTWGIVYEFLRVVTHPRVFPSPWVLARAWGFVEALRASASLEILVAGERHAAVAERTIREVPGLAGNLLFDVHTAVLMREHGVSRICTRDADFLRFPFLTVIDPLAGPDA